MLTADVQCPLHPSEGAVASRVGGSRVHGVAVSAADTCGSSPHAQAPVLTPGAGPEFIQLQGWVPVAFLHGLTCFLHPSKHLRGLTGGSGRTLLPGLQAVRRLAE